MRPALALSLLVLFLASETAGQRTTRELADGWRFVFGDAGLGVKPDAGTVIALPHTWNALDGQNGKAADPALPDGYFRGACWYTRDLPWEAGWTGRRVFLRFEAASIVCDVWINDVHLGQHRGAFTAFTFELTPHLRRDAPNTLRVRVDNSRFEDVAPLQGDFTMFGGLYRPVHLLVTDQVAIAPDYHASPGVFITQRSVGKEEARVEVKTLVSNGAKEDVDVDVSTIVTDTSGTVVARTRSPVRIPGAAADLPVVQALTIAEPHLWQGRTDPYLYSVEVSVHRDGRTVDQVRQPLGLRTIAVTDDQGVLLNGTPYPLHGVNRHQDRMNQGWALSRADHEEDIAMILELGCTSVRLAHYPQSSVVHDLCDRGGLLVWQEIPIVDRISGLPEFARNARRQLTEMILQGFNHPSLCFWGLFNELNSEWAQKPSPPPDALIAELRDLARELDGSRPTVGASWLRTASPLHEIPGQIAFNVYPGWYWGTPEDFAPLVAELSGFLGGRRIGISEYGAGASAFQHEEGLLKPPASTSSKFHPEEWQARFHERIWAQARSDPHLWGTWIWCMFDFAADQRDEGDAPGRNDKGLVTYDRKIRKDAFYFYQANWTTAPMVHIAGSRFERRREPVQTVHVYTTCTEVELFVNGESQGIVAPDETHVCRWPAVALVRGSNHVEAVARDGGREFRTSCAWFLAPTTPPPSGEAETGGDS